MEIRWHFLPNITSLVTFFSHSLTFTLILILSQNSRSFVLVLSLSLTFSLRRHLSSSPPSLHSLWFSPHILNLCVRSILLPILSRSPILGLSLSQPLQGFDFDFTILILKVNHEIDLTISIPLQGLRFNVDPSLK